ncbi:epoxide hydrolase 4-like isoform X2 [Homarus americanus]|uniref:epoxide hydrolase 4-like isoform X2 n=1 Tax=Homarus americanus TaxID=6706 RepID=UPI001C47804B|nr:epoxide hydrolase 4-like isoform X2 [Homarus americanus]
MWDCVRVNLSAATDTVWAALRWLTLALVEWTLAVVYGVLMLGKLVWAWSRGALHPPFVRVVPPQCLHDPLLGRHKFIKLQNMKLHYVEAGSPFNPLLVMIHGAPDFWFTWRRQIPALSHDYWVVAVDMRGCGDSDTPRLRTQYTTALLADDVAHLIRLLGQTSAHLMCAGVGGQVGWHMCYHYPQLVSKMVLIHCPHPYVIRHMVNTLWMNYYKSWYLWFVRLPFLPEMAAQVNDVGLVDRLFSSLVKNKTITEEELEAYKFTFSRREDWTGPLHHLRQLDLRRPREDEPSPDVITKPILLIMGDSDHLLPIDTAYRSAEYVERITIKPIPGGVYLSHLSHASQVNQMVGEFLREMPWRPLSPLETPQSSSLVGRVMGASLAAVTSTVRPRGRWI